jgi:hypothetical protein
MRKVLDNNGPMFQRHFRAYMLRLILVAATYRFVFDKVLEANTLPNRFHGTRFLPEAFLKERVTLLTDLYCNKTQSPQFMYSFCAVIHPAWTLTRARPPAILLHTMLSAMFRIGLNNVDGAWLHTAESMNLLSVLQQSKYLRVPVTNDFGNALRCAGLYIEPCLMLLPKKISTDLVAFMRSKDLARYPIANAEAVQALVTQRGGLREACEWREIFNIKLGGFAVDWMPVRRVAKEPIYTTRTDSHRTTALQHTKFIYNDTLRKSTASIKENADKFVMRDLGTMRVGLHGALYTYERRYDQGLYDTIFGVCETFVGHLMDNVLDYDFNTGKSTLNVGAATLLTENMDSRLPHAVASAKQWYLTEPWTEPAETEQELRLEMSRMHADRHRRMHTGAQGAAAACTAYESADEDDTTTQQAAAPEVPVEAPCPPPAKRVKETVLLDKPRQWHAQQVMTRLKLYDDTIHRGVTNYFDPREKVEIEGGGGETLLQVNGWADKIME